MEKGTPRCLPGLAFVGLLPFPVMPFLGDCLLDGDITLPGDLGFVGVVDIFALSLGDWGGVRQDSTLSIGEEGVAG